MVEYEIHGKVLQNGVYRVDAVVTGSDEVIGSAFYGRQDGIEDFGPIQVNPPFRGNGVGTSLLKAIEDYAVGPVIGKFKPDTGEEMAAKSFYQKNGYKVDEEGLLKKYNL